MSAEQTLASVFLEGRTQNKWTERPVDPKLLEKLYEYVKMGPTSANCCPLRLVFLCSKAAKEQLKPFLAPGNVEKAMSAPVVTILATDMEFSAHMEQLFPPMPKMFADFGAEKIQEAAFRNATLQAGYFVCVARALGLDCGPMSGFDNAGVDGSFFAGNAWKSNFLCNLGHGDPSGLWDRLPRLEFSQACQIL